jgi:hypothetical protein
MLSSMLAICSRKTLFLLLTKAVIFFISFYCCRLLQVALVAPPIIDLHPQLPSTIPAVG